MAIKRYIADADNTITNAFQEDFKTRGTGSNMGRSDVLEVFSIYEQVGTGSNSDELSRILIKFPISNISSDRSNGLIPASGSVNFYLNLYNTEHRQTTPQLFKLTVNAVSSSWEEGYGLDMEKYKDLTYDKIGSNWINANNSFVSASATLTALSKTAGQANTRVLTVADSSGNSVNFQIDNSLSTSTATKIAFANANSNADQFATNIVAAINAANAAGTLNVVGSSSEASVTLTQTAEGFSGNSAADLAGTSISDSVVTVVSQFGGGSGKWATAGGDIYTDSSSSFEQSFDTGLEDLSVDITTLVEQWIDGGTLGDKDNYGVLIKLSSSYEASGSTNLNGATISYYTKKFFSRTSEFFFKKPNIEARWDSSRRDNRGNFYISSSMVPGSENLNTLYMYNYIRGNLRDIAGNSTYVPVLNLYYSSGSVPEGTAAYFRNSSNTEVNYLSASRVSTGIYKAQFSVTSSIVTDTYPYLVDVWTYQYHADGSPNEIHTGSAISPKNFEFSNYNPNSNYVVSVPGLKKTYQNTQTERFRVFVRNKKWSPNVYTKAVSTPDTLLIESASYKIIRLVDDEVVINYGTSSTNHTVMSYDADGNYFDLDMSLLEEDYMYGLKFAFYEDSVSSYVEQPYIFKFRVIK